MKIVCPCHIQFNNAIGWQLIIGSNWTNLRTKKCTWINIIIETNTCKNENDRLSQDISNMGLKYGCHTLIDINGINDLISIIINILESWIKSYSIMEINQS